jgi:hypothetical protein
MDPESLLPCSQERAIQQQNLSIVAVYDVICPLYALTRHAKQGSAYLLAFLKHPVLIPTSNELA